MKDYVERFDEPNMEYYRTVYANSVRWQDEDIEGKRILIYMEQGIGDQIMFLRFLRLVKERSPKSITLHAPANMERLIRHLGCEFADKENETLPEHDLHVCSLSLPFVLKKAIPVEPYIKLIEKTDLGDEGGSKVGIAWEGNPDHPNNKIRNCPLKFFKPLLDKGVNFYHIKPEIHDWDLIEGCHDWIINGSEINDWYDTAKFINALDYVVTVDTGVLHLAGAMGKRTYALLGPGIPDPRWSELWYPTVRFVQGTWEECIKFVIDKQF